MLVITLLSTLRTFVARPGVRSAARNFGWLVADKGVRLVLGLLVGFWVARYLGPGKFGLLSYTLAVVALGMSLVELGLDAVLRRELLSRPEEAPSLLAAALRLRLVAALGCYVLLAGWALTVGSSGEERALFLVLGLTFFQPVGLVADIWLQARLQARAAVIAQWVALAVGAVLRVGLIQQGAGLVAFAWVAVVELVLMAGATWRAARRAGMRTGGRRPATDVLRRLVRAAWPLVLSGLAVAVYLRIDVVMLRSLLGSDSAGIYAAAVRISELGYFVPVLLAGSVLPALLRSRAQGDAAYGRRLQQFYDLNAALAYGLAAVTALAAGPVIRLAYGADFAPAVPVLTWHAWSSVFVFLGVARSQFLVNENLGVFYFASTAAGAVANIGLNLWLIPRAGAVGAAQATLISYALAGWISSWLHPAVRANAAMQTRALLLPLRAWQYLRPR
jgi:O-antigen/teichoic acid export membrane protein